MQQTIGTNEVSSLESTSQALKATVHLLTTPPDASMVRSLRSGTMLAELDDALARIPLAGHERDLEVIAAIVGAGDVESVVQVLHEEAKRLFRARYPRAVAPLYESMWIEPNRVSLGKAAIEVADVYRRNGVRVGSLIGETAPDHLGRELHFVAYTMEQEIEGAARGDDSSVEKWASTRMLFVAEHVNNWMPDFVDAVCEDGESGFYCAVAVICGSLIGVL